MSLSLLLSEENPSLSSESAGSALFRLSQSTLSTQSSALSTSQVQVDGMVCHFLEEAAHFSTFASIVAGGGASRLARTGILALGSNATGWGARAVQISAAIGGLGAEVVAFETTGRGIQTVGANLVFARDVGGRSDNDGGRFHDDGRSQGSPLQMNPNLWKWFGEGGLRQGFYSSFFTFGALRGAGWAARGHNIVFQHMAQSTAMVAGHNFAAALNIFPAPEGDLAQQFMDAERTNIQLAAGMGLLHTTLPFLHAFEKSLDLVNQSREAEFAKNEWKTERSRPDRSQSKVSLSFLALGAGLTTLLGPRLSLAAENRDRLTEIFSPEGGGGWGLWVAAAVGGAILGRILGGYVTYRRNRDLYPSSKVYWTTPEGSRQLSEFIKSRTDVDYTKTFGDHRVVCFGEFHHKREIQNEFLRIIPFLKEQGVTHIAMEAFFSSEQPVLDRYFKDPEFGELQNVFWKNRVKDPSTLVHQIGLMAVWEMEWSLNVVIEAMTHGIRIVGLEVEGEKGESGRWKKFIESLRIDPARMEVRNRHWVKQIAPYLQRPDTKIAVLAGSGHYDYSRGDHSFNQLLQKELGVDSSVVNFSPDVEKKEDSEFILKGMRGVLGQLPRQAKSLGIEHERFMIDTRSHREKAEADFLVYLPRHEKPKTESHETKPAKKGGSHGGATPLLLTTFGAGMATLLGPSDLFAAVERVTQTAPSTVEEISHAASSHGLTGLFTAVGIGLGVLAMAASRKGKGKKGGLGGFTLDEIMGALHQKVSLFAVRQNLEAPYYFRSPKRFKDSFSILWKNAIATQDVRRQEEVSQHILALSENATLPMIRTVAKIIRKGEAKGEDNSPFLAFLELVSENHGDPRVKQKAQETLETHFREQQEILRAMETGRVADDWDPGEIFAQIDEAIKKDEGLKALDLVSLLNKRALRNREMEIALPLFLHDHPLIRHYMYDEVMNILGLSSDLRSLWETFEKFKILEEIRSEDRLRIYYAKLVLELMAENGIEEARDLLLKEFDPEGEPIGPRDPDKGGR